MPPVRFATMPVRTVLLGGLGAALIASSMLAERAMSSGEESSADQTKVCLGPSYSLEDGCRSEVHTLSQPEFGRAYVVTNASERAGVDQYELYYLDGDGSRELVAVRQTSTAKVPRYVLNLADLTSASAGPPRPGTYQLVTKSAGVDAAYQLVVTAPESDPTPTPTSTSTSRPTSSDSATGA